MKKKWILCLAAVAASSFFANPSPVTAAEKVIAYYFHGNARCPTCRKLEQYSREAIESNFKDELASGKLEFRAVNVDEAGNGHYVKKYDLYTKSLVLSKVDEGREVGSKNLDKIWELVRYKQKFFDYVTKEIRHFLFLEGM